MKKCNYFTMKLSLMVIALLMTFSTLSVGILKAQDTGPTNYCYPKSEALNVMNQWSNGQGWCYNSYLKQYNYMYYFTCPILETMIVDVASGEVKLDRVSRTNYGYSGTYSGEWEACYVYTGAKGEMDPGGLFDIKTWHNSNYYGYSGTDYCSYGYTNMYVFRLWIDYNIDGDFDDPGEWVNDPAVISSGVTQKIGTTHDWRFGYVPCLTNYLETYRVKISDNQKTGVTRMRAASAYYYPYTLGYARGQSADACWNGYWQDYSMYGYPPGTYYGYNMGEMEDYLIDFAVSFKGSFPDNKPPYDILLAGELYNGRDATFERPYVKFGGPQPAGTLISYQIVGPLPSTNIIYEAKDPVTGSSQISAGIDVLGPTNVRYDIQKATGPAVAAGSTYAFKYTVGGEYKVIMGMKKPAQADFKYQSKNFTVSWEWDMAAASITRPLSNGDPQYFKYPRGLTMDLQGTVQNVGLRTVVKFDAHYRVYDKNNQLLVERKIAYDTANAGQPALPLKAIAPLNFGTVRFDGTGAYKAILTVEFSKDVYTYNDQYKRFDEAPYYFEIADEVQAEAFAINVPKSGSNVSVNRPFVPVVDLKNNGVGDISNCPTTLTVTEEPGGSVVFSETINVQDIPTGRYNIKSVRFGSKVITKSGQYRMTLEVNHPDDVVKEDNKISIIFYAVDGIAGTYTIGLAKKGQAKNYDTFDAALDEMFLKGIAGSVQYLLTDDEYTVTSRGDNTPALDLSTAIGGLGVNKETGAINTITFKPSVDKGVSRGSVRVNLVSKNGIGVFLGQSLISSISNSIQNETWGTSTFVSNCNNGGYITFDGGPVNSLTFILKSDKTAFGSVFYLNAGAKNITIKNINMENGSANLACSVKLPNVNFSVVDGFIWTADESMTQSGLQGYSAGIVNRAKILSLKSEALTLALDTIPNVNNSFMNNDISGFGYGIVSYGIGALKVAELQEYRPYYNQNTVISGNKIYNVTGGGIVVGHEQNCQVSNNTIFDINGNCGSFAAGIIAGGNSSQDLLGYNNVGLKIDANQISNVRGTNAVYGILVDQNLNKFPLGPVYQNFPEGDDDIMVTNNAIFDIKAKLSTTTRVGIYALTERNHTISDPTTQMLTPRHTDISIKKLFVANNTVLMNEDGVANNGYIAGVALQQTYSAKLFNNAVAVTDGNLNPTSLVASAIFYQGVMPKEDGGLIADRNAYWLGGSNASAYRHVFNDWKNKIIDYGTRIEYLTLEQWQMASKIEMNSVATGNFVNEQYFMGDYPAVLKVKTTIKGSILSKRGDKITSYSKDVYGATRGLTGSRYDIGAIEFNGSMYNRDAEMLSITEPGTYRATDGIFSDAEYTMTEAPIAVKAILRNNSSLQITDKKVYAKIYRELSSGTWQQEGSTIEKLVTINETENTTVDFQLADGIGDEFVPKTYNDLRSENYTIPPQFMGMTPNVTPRYKIIISMDADEYSNNNSTEKIVRFYLRRSSVRVLVSNQSYVDTTAKGLSADQLASGLNKLRLDYGMKRLGWEIQLANGRYDYDVFQRAGWEPRNVNYSNYRTMLWSDGNDNALTRLQKLDITNFAAKGTVEEKKNIILMSQEMVRSNTNYDDADEVFVHDILRAEYRFPGNPLGANVSYAGKSITGVGLGKNNVFQINSTFVAGDANPMPGLMNILETGDGLSFMAIRYDVVRNNEWPDEARIGGVASSNLTTNVMHVGIDWRHFGDIEKVLRSSFDFVEGNGGVVIPVVLLSFDAVKSGKRVDISWSTASEVKSSKFEVERAEVTIDGKGTFTKIDEVTAAGKSNIIKHYGPVVDNNVNYGKTYAYRLNMFDRDGKSEYSSEKIVTLDGVENMLSILPNPVTSTSKVEYTLNTSMNIQLSLYDAVGKEVISIANGYKNAGLYTFELNASELVSGTYTMVLKSGDIMLTEKVNVVK